jgi:hypothetical protein
MPKEFYTERDIEDLFKRGVTSVVVTDDVVVTDLGREKARRLGVELLREHDQPQSAPIRPYIAKVQTQRSKTPVPMGPSPGIQPAKGDSDLHTRVQAAVISRLGDSVDPTLLSTIVRRVLDNIGTK